MGKPSIAETVRDLMVKEQKTRVWLGDHGLLKTAYETATGKPTMGFGIRSALQAVSKSKLFRRAGRIKSHGFTDRQWWRPVYELVEAQPPMPEGD